VWIIVHTIKWLLTLLKSYLSDKYLFTCICSPKMSPFFISLWYKRWPICVIFGIQYTELIHIRAVIHLPSHLIYVLLLHYLGKNANCIVLTLTIKVTHCHCTKLVNIQFIHAACTSVQLASPHSTEISDAIDTQCFAMSINQALSQVGHILNWHLIHLFLHHATVSIVMCMKSRAILRP